MMAMTGWRSIMVLQARQCSIAFMSQAIRVSTAWGSPNIAAVPIMELERQPEGK